MSSIHFIPITQADNVNPFTSICFNGFFNILFQKVWLNPFSIKMQIQLDSLTSQIKFPKC